MNGMTQPVNILELDLGYLLGSDLMQYLDQTYLQVVHDKGSDNLRRAVHIAQSTVQNYLASLYDLTSEYQKRRWDRNGVVLRLVTFLACWEIASGDEAIKKSLTDAYQDFRRTIDELQSRRQSLLDVTTVDTSLRMSAEVISVKSEYLY